MTDLVMSVGKYFLKTGALLRMYLGDIVETASPAGCHLFNKKNPKPTAGSAVSHIILFIVLVYYANDFEEKTVNGFIKFHCSP